MPIIKAPSTASGATKEFFVPALAFQSNGSFFYTAGVGNYPIGAIGNNAGTDAARFAFFVPNDFNSISAVRVVMIPDTTETITWDLDVSLNAVGEAYNNVTASVANQTTEVTQNQMTEVDINVGSAFNGLAANDYVGIVFGSDTVELRILGLRFKYA